MRPDYPGHLIRQGNTGEDVRLIQEALGIQQTELFGPTTEAIVTKFQRSHDLEPDGVVGPQTWAAIFAPILAPASLGRETLKQALKYVGVHEQPLGSNRGPQVDQWNQRAGVPLGSPWCAAFAYSCCDDAAKALGVKNPLPRTGSSSALFRWAKGAGRIVASPEPGDLGLVIGGDTGHYHTVIVERVLAGMERVATIEGNSNDDGSANGVEVARRGNGRRFASMDFVRL